VHLPSRYQACRQSSDLIERGQNGDQVEIFLPTMVTQRSVLGSGGEALRIQTCSQDHYDSRAEQDQKRGGTNKEQYTTSEKEPLSTMAVQGD
jgi:hypothetical protein